ncbi:MAG: branched-chain amino acid transport system permease protein [Pseudonocardiales bacterium]|jgi:ABC-type branched-subunit amino acid transport system permease subunit|nr:branched-chain amino acid transport system permease protein [Pseudonocardiales bacterium]
MKTGFFSSPHVKRLAGCMALAFVLALMIGNQEGSQDDYGLAFRQAIFSPRIILFIVIGLLVFAAMTFWPYITPYLLRPGVRPLAVGGITVLVSQTLLKWSDDGRTGNGKFNSVASKAANTDGLAPMAKLFFSNYLGWILLLVTFGLGAAAILISLRALAWVAAVLGVVGGIWAYTSQAAVRDFLGTPDHSTGGGVALIGYLTLAAAALATALATGDIADTRAFVNRLLAWRPGMPLVVLGLIVGVIAFVQATWFSPQGSNQTLTDTKTFFQGNGLANLAYQYLAWLGYVLFIATLLTAAAASYLRHRILGWVAAGLGAVALLLSLITMYDMTDLAAAAGVDGATGPWQNLGSGAWMACAAFFVLAGAGLVVATLGARDEQGELAPAEAPAARSSDTLSRGFSAPGSSKVFLFVILATALFYPPTATGFWQKVLVSEIGIYVLLAIGLNVVVGWAGLLDLGFIAFYAIGSYTTAYLTGALPFKPPSFLHLSPLLAIPFAIAICLLAGVALGAPTLRLRGDYLAIVTLGFGEIIRITANNNPGNITNGPKGAFGIPHPRIELGPIKFVWGQNNLQYWYLLLVLIVIVVLLFRRLEASRLGRAWAAIREDEVAAQATGINTTRVKLLAFAIGASTSGVAGVFFASQIGYINPENFVLNNSILVVAYVVFGGMGSLPGAMAGAAVLTWLPEFLKDQVPAEDRQMWIGAVVLLMMIFRPAGLIPAKRRAAELRGLNRSSSAEVGAVPEGEGMGVRA